MTEKSRILVVDDEASNLRLLGTLLSEEGFNVSVSRSGEEALEQIESNPPNLLLLDVVMPGLSGYEVCQRIRERTETRALPIILVTGARPEEERVKGLDAGADEFLTKPVNREELLARVRSLLRVERLHRENVEWNELLESRVQDQVAELQRLGSLKNFLPQKVAELIVSEGGDSLLKAKRREVTVCVIDLRGFTPFSETAEPEDVVCVLGEFYAEMGEIVEAHQGTVEHFAGDSMTIFFNAPLEIDEPERQALLTAIAMRDRFELLCSTWKKRGYDLGLGIGLSKGYATIGAIGFAGRWQYAAIGAVTNLAARMCSSAQHGEILAPLKFIVSVEEIAKYESLGDKEIKGFHRPIAVMRVDGLKDSAAESGV